MAPASHPVCSGGGRGCFLLPVSERDWLRAGWGLSQGRMAACLSQPPASAAAAGQLRPSGPPLHAALTHSQALAHHLAPAGIVQRDAVSSFLHGGGGGRSRSPL